MEPHGPTQDPAREPAAAAPTQQGKTSLPAEQPSSLSPAIAHQQPLLQTKTAPRLTITASLGANVLQLSGLLGILHRLIRSNLRHLKIGVRHQLIQCLIGLCLEPEIPGRPPAACRV